jgi:hypothetical protein
MSKKKEIQETQNRMKEYRAEWLALTPQGHLEEAASEMGFWLTAGGALDDLLVAYTQVQTHLLAGLLKLHLPPQQGGGELAAPTNTSDLAGR